MICFYLRTNLKFATMPMLHSIPNQVDISNYVETRTKWFHDNSMVLNPDKCHFTTKGFQDQNFDFHYENLVIKNSAEEKILRVKAHMLNIRTVANQKLSALGRI